MLDYEERGQGPALLLLHAFPLARGLFAPQLAGLSSRYRVVAPDLRGHGGSSGVGARRPADPTSTPWTIEDFADDVLELTNHLGLQRFAVAGVSLGGYVVCALLRRAPERVWAVILSNTRGDADDAAGRARREAMAQLAESDGAAPVAEQMGPKLLGATSRRARSDLVDWVDSTIRRTPPATIAATQRAMAARPDSLRLLDQLRPPALVLTGAEDELIPQPASVQLADALGVVPVIVERAGHLACLEQPEAWNGAVEPFLARYSNTSKS